jgi:hypothetical protein
MTTQPIAEALRDVLGPLRADIDTMQDVYLTREQRAAFDRIVAATLSEHGGGGEAVAWQTRVKFADGRWSGWAQVLSEDGAKEQCRRYREQLQTDAEYRTLYTAPPPQPRAEGMVLVPEKISEVEADMIGMPRAWYERAVATLSRVGKPFAAAPGEGSGDSLRMPTKEWARIVQDEPTGEDPYACGYQAALSAVAQVLGTPQPASQSAPTNPAEIGSKSVVAPSDGGGDINGR